MTDIESTPQTGSRPTLAGWVDALLDKKDWDLALVLALLVFFAPWQTLTAGAAAATVGGLLYWLRRADR
ncbi:hypothetical protein ACFWBR_41365 [Streptomyces sp. NPDC060006]|uniref:hypothetical protein n=1 Tax=Streptomyces sp. NPDC060006 TaxID=3347035 RepID=UPI0036822874